MSLCRIASRCLRSNFCRSPGLQVFRNVEQNVRFFCTTGSSTPSTSSSMHRNLIDILKSEYEQEKSDYKGIPQKLKNFLNSNVWTYEEKPGDVNIALSRKVHGNNVTIDFQLINPNLDGDDMDEDGSGEGRGMDNANEGETTDFSVSIEEAVDKSKGENSTGGGVTFYCTTVAGEEYRYLIGNVRLFSNEAEKNSVSGYNGPEFESLDASLQKSLETYLEMHGINSDVCDLIDELAIDKETREYTNWLQRFVKFLDK